jgi:uncharacterized protein (TIGR03118 family)
MGAPVCAFRSIVVSAALTAVIAGASPAVAESPAYQVRNLVSNISGRAAHTDPNLKNGWGVAFNPFGFVWVADNGTGVSTLYDGNGNPQSLVVSMPDFDPPTGIVFNGSTNDFVVTRGGVSGAAAFIFATENGTIAAWAPAVDRTHAIRVVDNSASGAIYKGLALAADGNRFLLYATDFHNRKIDVFDKNFQPVTLPAGFADPSMPSDFAPFGIQNLGGSVYVTYAKQDEEGEDDVAGKGLGAVNVFTATGNLVKRIAKGGQLNAPWGLAMAPADFGGFSNTLLIGNFGDGTINAFDLTRGKFVGQLSTSDRRPIVIPGLWGIAFGNGLQNQPTSTLFFAAGPDDEANGLYGRIDALP